MNVDIEQTGAHASPRLVRAVSLHLEGRRQEALAELDGLEAGDESVDVLAAKGHLQFELDQFDDALRTYEKLLAIAPGHPGAGFNIGVCYEKLDAGRMLPRVLRRRSQAIRKESKRITSKQTWAWEFVCSTLRNRSLRRSASTRC